MYLRPDEVARVLEKAGFTMDVVTQKAYGYRRGDNYVYVNREARMGRTALVIHPALKERSNMLAEPASDIKTCDHYEQFPLYLAGDAQQHYGIPHGFSSRMALERFLNGYLAKLSRPCRRINSLDKGPGEIGWREEATGRASRC